VKEVGHLSDLFFCLKFFPSQVLKTGSKFDWPENVIHGRANHIREPGPDAGWRNYFKNKLKIIWNIIKIVLYLYEQT
jgi:hypothetical protein